MSLLCVCLFSTAAAFDEEGAFNKGYDRKEMERRLVVLDKSKKKMRLREVDGGSILHGLFI